MTVAPARADAGLGRSQMTLVEVSGVAPVLPASTLCTPERPDGPAERSLLYCADPGGTSQAPPATSLLSRH